MKILFFFIWGGRTGSEVALYNFICHANRQQIAMGVACAQQGELMKGLPPDVPCFDYSDPMLARNGAALTGIRQLFDQALNSFYHRSYHALHGGYPSLKQATNLEKIWKIHETFKPDVWYINTLVQPYLLELALSRGVPCVLHSHELEQALSGLNRDDVRNIVEGPKLIITSSQAAARVLNALGRTQRVEVCYPTIDTTKVVSGPGVSAEIRRTLGLPADAFVWVMSGLLEPNKNPALFVDLAHELKAGDPRIHFLWIGGKESAYSLYVKEQARSLDLGGRMTWIEERTEDYYDYLNVADGFVLTSSRESFSLVSLEAAYLGKPVVAFDCGGVTEFLQPEMGIVVQNSRNAADLAGAMRRIMRGEAEFDPQVSRDRAASFDASLNVGHWEGVLQRNLTELSKKSEVSSR